ncbi:L,D-transpeptidase [Enterovirga rhinocerotis]|uniref:L,D-transpeptidase-like protein n=1 Tax=Enterovirga rhinocerotis TaxID=1339210 RepID=A0A4R7BWX6_9HYPH|nr:L,D-transpeptidase [Enterovirga rhinocerotis]TDR90394.1 L,D-transpeptidase-like protein [Enterovirga rhinocerotis]
MNITQNGGPPRLGASQIRRLALVVAACLGCLLAAKAHARERVSFDAGGVPAGTIVVRTSERALYLVDGYGSALRYRVAVGRPGKQWFGWSQIDGKHVHPAWSPPDEVRRDNPRLPDVIPGGSPANPMGPRALTLSGGEYAIHGTNRPSSVGTFASYGCIRMYNADIVDLYERVRVGTRVVVVR